MFLYRAVYNTVTIVIDGDDNGQIQKDASDRILAGKAGSA